jgi:hypothetical protein
MTLCVLLPAGVTLLTSFWSTVYYDVKPLWNPDNYQTVLTDPLIPSIATRFSTPSSLLGSSASSQPP